jgi:heme-degrading monooxygenase HmoA
LEGLQTSFRLRSRRRASNREEHAIARTYTHSIWTVKEGLEEEFVRRWLDLAEWSAAQGLAGPAKLLRDADNPRTFVSFGPWESLEKVARWRSSPGFHERVARLQEVLENFEPRTLDQVAES